MPAVQCQNCHKSFNAPERLAGRTVACPACKHPIQIPAMESQPPQTPQVSQRRPAEATKVEIQAKPKWLIPAAAGGGVLLITIIVIIMANMLGAKPEIRDFDDDSQVTIQDPSVGQSSALEQANAQDQTQDTSFNSNVNSQPAPSNAVPFNHKLIPSSEPPSKEVTISSPPQAAPAASSKDSLDDFLPSEAGTLIFSDRIHTVTRQGINEQQGRFLFLKFNEPVEMAMLEAYMPLILQAQNTKGQNINMGSEFIGYQSQLIIATHPEDFQNIFFQPSDGDVPDKRVHALAFNIQDQLASKGVLQAPLAETPINLALSWELPARKPVLASKKTVKKRSSKRRRPVPVLISKSSSTDSKPTSPAPPPMPPFKGKIIPMPVELTYTIGTGAKDEMVFYSEPDKAVWVYYPQTQKFERRMPYPKKPLLTCGGDKIAVYLEKNNKIAVYDMATGRIIRTLPNRFDGEIKALAMGSHNGDTCFVGVSRGSSSKEKFGFFINVINGQQTSFPLSLRYAYDDIFDDDALSYTARDLSQMIWKERQSARPTIVCFHQGVWRQQDIASSHGALLPLSNGKLCNRSGEVFEWEERITAKKYSSKKKTLYFPIHGSVYCLKVTSSGYAYIMDPETDELLHKLGQLPDVKEWKGYEKERFIHFNADTGQFAYLNHAKSQLITKTIDVWESISNSDHPYLSINVEHMPGMIRGDTWSYELNVKSSDSNISLSLLEGPEDLKMNGKTLSWQVPDYWSVPPIIKLSISNSKLQKEVTLPLRVYKRTPQGLRETDVAEGMVRDQTLIRLPKSISESMIGKDGRYVAFKQYHPIQWHIIDLVERKQITTIEDPGEIIAMGGTKMVTYSDESNSILVYSILSGRKVKTIKNPTSHPYIRKITMGSNNDHEALIHYSPSIKAHDSGMMVLNLRTGKGFPVKAKGVPTQGGYNTMDITSDPDLKALTCGRTLFLKRSGYNMSAAYSKTGSDGRPFPVNQQSLVHEETSYTSQVQAIRQFKVDQEKYLKLRPVIGSNLLAGITRTQKIYIFDPEASAPIQQWAGKVTQLGTDRNSMREGVDRFGISAKVGAGFIVPDSGNFIVIGGFSEARDASRRPPVITNLASTVHVISGKPWSYQLKAKNLSGPATYVLIKQPPGMSVTREGLLRWQVPASFDPSKQDTQVIVELRDTSGASSRKTFRLVPSIQRLDQQDIQTPAGLIALNSDLAIFKASHDSPYAAIAEGRQIYSIDPDTLRPIKKRSVNDDIHAMDIRKQQLFVAQAGRLTVYQLPELSTIKSYKLPTNAIQSIAAHPARDDCYLAAIDPKETDKVLRHKIMHVSQTSGRVTWLKETYGATLAFAPQNNQLITVISGSLVRHARFTTYWGENLAVAFQSYHSMMLRYEVIGAKSKLIEHTQNITRNPSHFDMSADGRTFSLLGKHEDAIPAYKTNRIGTVAMIYETGIHPTSLTHHPFMPLVAAGNQEDIYLFDRNSGARTEKPIDTGLSAIRRLYFTHLGDKLVVRGKHPVHGLVLKAVDLKMDPAELARRRKAGPMVADATGAGTLSPDAIGFRKISKDKVSASDLTGMTSVPAKTQKSPKEIARLTNPAVVMIRHDKGSGTGTFISQKGYILTCAHVLPFDNQGVKLLYKSATGKTIKTAAKVIARDEYFDLALLKSDDQAPVTQAVLGRSEVATGESVSAIGHPGMGDMILGYTMTSGIISSPKREIGKRTFIQTSASINPGMSGGPLLDEYGNIIGVVSLKASKIEGVGFAVHHKDVKTFLKKCLK